MKQQDNQFVFIQRDLFNFFWIILALYVILHLLGIGCPIKYLTGISCAGCGMVRAWGCLLKLDFTGAFHYHPLFILPPVGVALFLFRKKFSKRQFEICVFVIAALFIAVYVFRFFNAGDHVVEINLNNGLIGRFFNILKEGFK